MYYRTYTCLTELIRVLRNLYWYFGAHTGISDLIRVLQNLYLCYRSYSCAKVPVGTISRNRSGSYHIEGQIGLLQIRRLFVRRYKSQIHYTEITVVTTGLIITLQNLYLFYRYKSTRRYYQTYTYLTDTYTGISDMIRVLQNLYMYFRSYMYITELILVLQNLYLFIGLILVLQILYLCYRTDSCISDLILLRRYP